MKRKLMVVIIVVVLALFMSKLGLFNRILGSEETRIYNQLKSKDLSLSNINPSSTAKAVFRYITEFPKEQRQEIYNNLKDRLTEETKDELKKLLTSDTSSLCSRSTPYSNNAEFVRAMSLIYQRSPYLKVMFDQITNCLSIDYYSDKNNYPDAEGVFVFDKNLSTTEKLNIYVSPGYKGQSDLLTAFLLSHEISHAFKYSAQNTIGDGIKDTVDDCFDDEARAFTNMFIFLTGLNEGEREVVTSLASSGSGFAMNSKEVQFLTGYLELIGNEASNCPNTTEEYPYECIFNLFQKQVRLDKNYQIQCSNH